MLFKQVAVIDDHLPHDGPTNMAIDEVLLQSAAEPILRFYRWRQPTVSFGYFSRWEEAIAFAGGRPLVRRWTGGGIVLHAFDLTYSLIIPRSDEAGRLSSREIYAQVHRAVATSMETMGIRAELSRAAMTKVSDACFANAVHSDVIENGQKIAGAAHRKTANGLLHQGSIQRQRLDTVFRKKLASALADMRVWRQLNTSTLQRARPLAEQKYASVKWLQRR